MSDASPCGVTFRHDWHGFLDEDGRTRVCDGDLPSASICGSAATEGGRQ